MSSAVVVLVDGSNVLHSASWSDPGASAALVDRVAGWAAVEGVEVVLAFDGAVERSRPVGPVLVVATGAQEADDLLAERAARLAERGVEHWVVSSDRAVRQTAGARAGRVLGADAFVALLTRDAAGASDGDSPTPPTRLADALDADARARLEQLRRGRPTT